MRLGPFRLDAPVAKGGMGEVWRGEHVRQKVQVALKFLREDSPGLRESFSAEVRAVARLDHPGIILLFDHGVVDAEAAAATGGRLRTGSPWLAMEYCSGGTLKRATAKNWPGFRRLIFDILAALGHAHARGVLHRDLKPDNVIFAGFDDPRPGLKLTDFGLAFAHEADARATGAGSRTVVTGTPAYMAPEQFRRQWRDYGPWTDLYALGCLAWKLATGEPPFGQSRPPEVLGLAHEELPLPAFTPRFDVPAGVREWLGRLLEKDPARRIQRAADAAAALANLDGTRNPGGLVPADWRAAEPPRIPMRLVGAGLGLYPVRTVPMVNREAERDRLWAALLEAQETWSARLVLLHGPGGCGKTRLAEWLTERAHEVGGATVLAAEHATDGPDGLTRMFRRHLGCADLDGDALLARIEAVLHARGGAEPGEATALAAVLAAVLDHRVDDDAERHLVLRRLLERLCAERPVIVRLEDVQWGSDALAFALHVLRAQDEAPAPILFVLTARAEALAERPVEALRISDLMGLGSPATWLEVRPLGPADQVLLVEGLLGLGGDLARRVCDRSGGNPAFAVQLVGDWVERGVLEPAEDGFVLRPGAQAVLPDGIHAVWAARLDRALEPLGEGRGQAAAALEIAAALGEEVDEAEWRSACRVARVTVPEGLVERLTAERLIMPVEAEPGAIELVWAFTNGMLRESLERAARESGRRESHHRACAVMLLDRHGSPALAERLGRHFLAAEAWADALGFLMEGARERARQGDARGASALLIAREEALSSLGVLRQDARWGAGRLMHAQLLLRQGQYEGALELADLLPDEARRNGWNILLPETLTLRAELAAVQGQPAMAFDLYQEARTLFERRGDERGAALSLLGLGELAMTMGELDRAMRLLQQAQVPLARAGDHLLVADGLRLRAEVARRSGALDAASELISQALAAYTRVGNRGGQAEASCVAADIARARGDLDAATAGYRAALRRFEATGSGRALVPLVRLGLVLDLQDRRREAENVLDVARRLAYAQGLRPQLGIVHALLLPITALDPDLEPFDQHLDEAIALLDSSDLVDPDVAFAAQRAGDILADDPPRARRALLLAHAQWTALGRADKAAIVAARLPPA